MPPPHIISQVRSIGWQRAIAPSLDCTSSQYEFILLLLGVHFQTFFRFGDRRYSKIFTGNCRWTVIGPSPSHPNNSSLTKLNWMIQMYSEGLRGGQNSFCNAFSCTRGGRCCQQANYCTTCSGHQGSAFWQISDNPLSTQQPVVPATTGISFTVCLKAHAT